VSCIDDIIAASGDVLSKREAAELLRKFNDLTGEMSDSSRLGTLDAMLSAARENMVEKNLLAANLAKRTELSHKVTLGQSLSRVDGLIQKGKTVKQAIDSLFFGSPEDRQGLVQLFNGAKERPMVHLIASLEEQGLTDHFRDPHVVREALEVLYDPKAKNVSPEAQKIGMILRESQKFAVSRLNEVGAYTLDRPSVLLSAYSADAGKVTSMGKDGFVQFMKGLELDPKAFEGMDDTEITHHFEKVYERIANGHGFRAPTGTFDGLSGLTKERFRDVTKSMSPNYDIPFASADAYAKYAEQFGADPINAMLFRQIDRLGRGVGLMEAFGPSPDRLLADLLASLDPKMTPEDRAFLNRTNTPSGPVSTLDVIKELPKTALRFFDQTFHSAHPEDALAVMSGETSVPIDTSFARLGQGLRSWSSMAALGQGVFMQITDLPVKMAQLAKFGKNGALDGILEPFKAFAENATEGNRKAYLARMGVGADILIRNMAHDIAGDGGYLPGKWAKTMEMYFKLNGMHWWDQVQRRSNSDFLSTNIAWALKNPAEATDIHALLDSYGFTKAEKAVMANSIGDAGGIEGIDPRKLEAADGKLYERFLGVMQDINSSVTPTPGIKERAIVTKGTKPGTLEGEFLRSFMLFKTYPIMFMTRVFPQIHYNIGTGGTVATMASMMAFWYLGDSLKSLSKGQTPRDLQKPDTWYQMMSRSGFGGLYGDIMASNYNQYGMDFWSSIGGPVAGQINNAAQLGSGLTHWKETKDGWRPELTGKMAISKVRRALPSLHLEQTILDNTLIHAMIKLSDPDYQQRRNQDMEERTGQQNLIWRQ
jgi:hypothetical protein